MNEMLFNAVLGLITALITVATHSLRDYLSKKKGQAAVQTVNILAQNAVQATEQIYNDLKGKDKLDRALGMVEDGLAQAGIEMPKSQILVALEASVKAMNDGWKYKLK